MRGMTIGDLTEDKIEYISIHMPHAGHDRFMRTSIKEMDDFNPHAPCGA